MRYIAAQVMCMRLPAAQLGSKVACQSGGLSRIAYLHCGATNTHNLSAGSEVAGLARLQFLGSLLPATPWQLTPVVPGPPVQTERAIRFVGLSTALANAQDLADWLGITGPVGGLSLTCSLCLFAAFY